MKVITMKTSHRPTTTEKLIKAILKRDFDAFKFTNKQFIRNNEAYFPNFSGMIA